MASRLTRAIVAVGVPDSNADIRYLGGFSAADPVVCCARGSRRWVVVPAMEYSRACKAVAAVPGCTVWTPDSLGLAGPARRSTAAWTLHAIRRLGWDEVTVSADFPVAVYQHLRRYRIGVQLATGPLLPQRMVKTERELTCMRESQRAAVIAMRSAVAMIERSQIDSDNNLRLGKVLLTSEAVQRRIADVLLDHRCYCADTIVAGGVTGASPHERGRGPLPAHFPIVIDIFPRHLDHGYWGDLTRTVVRGTPAPYLRRMYAAVRAAQREALAHVRAGVMACTVHNAACEVFARRQFKTALTPDGPEGFIHGTGHGLGLDVHEDPRVAVNRDRLRAGQVITVEPGLYYPQWGGIRIEDSIIVTADGWRFLVPCEKRFECSAHK